MGHLIFDPKCTGTFWAVSMGLQLTCFTFDPKCTGTFWAVSTEHLTFDPKCTGTFWAVLMVLWLTGGTMSSNGAKASKSQQKPANGTPPMQEPIERSSQH